MARPAKVPAALLVEDIGLWPRHTMDSSHVGALAEALLSGATLPPVTADRKSRRLTDGFHRTRAHLKAFGPDAEIEVFWRAYADEAAMFQDAINLNNSHGRRLTSFDHARILQRAKELGISRETILTSLRIRDVKLKRVEKYAKRSDGTKTALKRGLRHLDDKELSEAQEAYNEASSGWPPSFHAKQLSMAIRAGIPEISDTFREALIDLHGLIEELALV